MRALLALTLLASPALGDGYAAFQSPTGTIHCVMSDGEGGTEARCDLQALSHDFTRPAGGCSFGWGQAFVINERGKGHLACEPETVMDRGNPILPYGSVVSMGGVSCVSARTGITCTNGSGNGFYIARTAWAARLF